MKILIIREAFKLRLSLMMTLNNENPLKTTAKTSSSSPYLEFTILLYKYELLYLPTYHNIFVQTFFLEKYGWRIPFLPTVWIYVQSFVVFFRTLSLGKPPNQKMSQKVEKVHYFLEFGKNWRLGKESS